MKKILTTLIFILSISFSLIGCEEKDNNSKITKAPNVTNTANSKTGAEVQESSATKNSAIQNGKANSSSNVKLTPEDTNTKLQQLSNTMNKLDYTLNGLDDTNEITQTDTVINNNLK